MAFHDLVNKLISYAWATLLGVWVLMAFFSSRVEKRESYGGRMLTLLLGLLPFALLFSNAHRWGLLAERFLPETLPWAVVGVAATYAGMALAIWARFILGRNWSAAVTVKHGHTLISSGPYSVVRHPIYSGLLLAILGTAIAIGQWRGVAAVMAAFLVWLVKLRTEERFMVEKFGAQYEDYRRRTRALVPFIF